MQKETHRDESASQAPRPDSASNKLLFTVAERAQKAATGRELVVHLKSRQTIVQATLHAQLLEITSV